MKNTLISTAISLAIGVTAAQVYAQAPATNQTQSGQDASHNREVLHPDRMDADVKPMADVKEKMSHNDTVDHDFDVEEFIETASAKGLAEIETAKMALKDGSPSLHTFANRMIEHHKAANVKLREVAQRENIEMADEASLMDKAKAMILDIRDDSFDEAYIDNQISAHEDAIDRYNRATQSDNSQIRAYAQQTLPTLQEHLQMAKELKSQHTASSH